MKKKVKVAILIIGNEILSGRTQDLNVSFLSSWLNINCGLSVLEVRVIPDVEKIIKFNVLELSKNFKYVFTTGGIGPTHDDITSKSISRAFNVKYCFDEEAYAILENYYGKKNFNIARKKMAKIPKGAKLIYNPSSAAPGFIINNVICLPGVPSILKSMMPNVRKFLIKGPTVFSRTIKLHTVESKIAKLMTNLQSRYSSKLEIGSYPFFKLGKVGVAVVFRSISKKIINASTMIFLNKVKKNKIKINDIE